MKTLGIVGGGQLARMLTEAAHGLGFRVVVLDPTPDSPGGQVADEQIVGSFTDTGMIRALADKVQTRRCKQFDRSYESGRPYRCRVCGQFHIGTKQPVRSKRDMRHYRMRGEAALKRAMA